MKAFSEWASQYYGQMLVSFMYREANDEAHEDIIEEYLQRDDHREEMLQAGVEIEAAYEESDEY